MTQERSPGVGLLWRPPAKLAGWPLVCSGDPGVYGMASPILELAEEFPRWKWKSSPSSDRRHQRGPPLLAHP